MTHYKGLLSFLLSCYKTEESGQTWVLHFVVPLPSVPGAGFRAGTEEIQQSIYDDVCYKSKRRWGGERREAVSEQPDTPQHTPEAAQCPQIQLCHFTAKVNSEQGCQGRHQGEMLGTKLKMFICLWPEL